MLLAYRTETKNKYILSAHIGNHRASQTYSRYSFSFIRRVLKINLCSNSLPPQPNINHLCNTQQAYRSVSTRQGVVKRTKIFGIKKSLGFLLGFFAKFSGILGFFSRFSSMFFFGILFSVEFFPHIFAIYKKLYNYYINLFYEIIN